MRYGNSIEYGIWEWESAKRSQKAICHNIRYPVYLVEGSVLACLGLVMIHDKRLNES